MHTKQIIISESVTLGDTIRERRDQIETKKMGKSAVSILNPGKDLAIGQSSEIPYVFSKELLTLPN